MTIVMTSAPAAVLAPLMLPDMWISENRMISNSLVIKREFDSDERVIRVTQVSSEPERPAQLFLRDLVMTLKELGYHAYVSVG